MEGGWGRADPEADGGGWGRADPEAYMGILIPSYLTAYFTFIKIMIQ